jgi:uncharacterized membrane protein YgdD (TMEM256/DUF423 family)
MDVIRFIAALSAALAIAAGAFGAHGASEQAAEWLKTGGSYQLIHAVAALVVMERSRGGAWALLAGSFVFAGTLYLMALGLPRWLGAITPIGGAVMIGAWLWIAYRALRHRSEQ